MLNGSRVFRVRFAQLMFTISERFVNSYMLLC